LELLDRVEGRVAGEEGESRVQSPAGDEQQREAGTGLLEVNANRTSFEDRGGSPSLPGLLSEHARRCGHCRRGGSRREDIASDRIHHRRPPWSLLCCVGICSTGFLSPKQRYARPPPERGRATR